MKGALSAILRPYAGKPVILDSILLLFQWCTTFDPSLVHRFKRLSSFQSEDIELLQEVLSIFSEVRTTPHVLTEVSNLANSLAGGLKADWSLYFSETVPKIPEKYLPASYIAANSLIRLGLTDAGLASFAAIHVIMTLDFPLSNALASQGLKTINFTHLRVLQYE